VREIENQPASRRDFEQKSTWVGLGTKAREVQLQAVQLRRRKQVDYFPDRSLLLHGKLRLDRRAALSVFIALIFLQNPW
jgi:hypothetical protein